MVEVTLILADVLQFSLKDFRWTVDEFVDLLLQLLILQPLPHQLFFVQLKFVVDFADEVDQFVEVLVRMVDVQVGDLLDKKILRKFKLVFIRQQILLLPMRLYLLDFLIKPVCQITIIVQSLFGIFHQVVLWKELQHLRLFLHLLIVFEIVIELQEDFICFIHVLGGIKLREVRLFFEHFS